MALHLVTGFKGEAHITPTDIGAFNAGTYGMGEYVLKTGNMFKAEKSGENNQIKILDGDAVIKGRHISQKVGQYTMLTIDNCEQQNEKRIDLIVIRYTKENQTGVENIEFAVIKGTPVTSGEPEVPSITEGNLLSDPDNCLIHEMPLYKITIEGYTVGELEQLFETTGGIEELHTKIANQFIKHVKFGTYRGDGNSSQFIDVGFTPDAVYVCRSDGATNVAIEDMSDSTGFKRGFYGGLAFNSSTNNIRNSCRYWHGNDSSDHTIVDIETNGFRVYYETIKNGTREWRIWSNSTSTFHYVAIKLSGN